MKKIKNKMLLLIGIIGLYILVQLFVLPFLSSHYSTNPKINLLLEFWESFNINCMAIGGLFAFILFKNHNFLKILYSKWVQIFSLVLLILLFIFPLHIRGIHYEIYALLFGILILNLSSNPDSLFNLENKLFNFLGKISYGMYMYHAIAVVVAVKILDKIGCNYFLLQLLGSLALTVVISAFSYNYLEKRFIKMKIKFSKIVSGDNVKA